MIHTLQPIYDEHSKILIIGTFPSVKSREAGFYYYHPQNRFWKVISTLINVRVPETIEEKKAMLLRNHIALWDVVQSCDIIGSSDQSIENVVPNDIAMILHASKIERIYANGSKAFELYHRYCIENTKKEIRKLPSTSPANASYTLKKLIESWRKEIEIVD